MIGSEEEKAKVKNDLEQKETAAAGLLECIQKALDGHIKQVRLSTCLGGTPARLAATETYCGDQLDRLLQRGRSRDQNGHRTLELNPSHPIFLKMRERFERNDHDAVLDACAELLLGYALIAEGAELPDPSRFNRLLAGCILHTL